MSKTFISLLIIYTLFSVEVASQNIQLQISGANDIETTTIDSISYKKNHSDLNTMQREIDSMQLRLFQIGYIENAFDKIRKQNGNKQVLTLNSCG